MASNNKISATLSDADKIATLACIQQAESKMPFLINIPANEKPTRTMGSKSVEYVNLCLQGAKKYPTKLTMEFDTPEFDRDVTLLNQLWSIRIAVADLLGKLDDTMAAASSDAMKASDEVYNALKNAAKKDGSVKDLLDRIALRYSAQSKPRPKAPQPPEGGAKAQ